MMLRTTSKKCEQDLGEGYSMPDKDYNCILHAGVPKSILLHPDYLDSFLKTRNFDLENLG